MTTTFNVIRTAVYTNVPSGIITLDYQVSPSDIFLIGSTSRSVVLSLPTSSTVSDEFDGLRFRVTTGPVGAIIYPGSTSATILKTLTAGQWAECVLCAPSPTNGAAYVWRLSAFGGP